FTFLQFQNHVYIWQNHPIILRCGRSQLLIFQAIIMKCKTGCENKFSTFQLIVKPEKSIRKSVGYIIVEIVFRKSVLSTIIQNLKNCRVEFLVAVGCSNCKI